MHVLAGQRGKGRGALAMRSFPSWAVPPERPLWIVRGTFMPDASTPPGSSRPRTSSPSPAKGTGDGGNVFIVDDSDAGLEVGPYLAQWCDYSSAIDIATGYFEIGGLLSLREKWQSLDRVRILMGDEVSYRTKQAFERGLVRIQSRLDGSLEGTLRYPSDTPVAGNWATWT